MSKENLTCSPFSVPHLQQNKMEDRLDEAIHVLRNHAVGQTSGLPGSHEETMHSLLGAAAGVLGANFPAAVLSLANRHSMVRICRRYPYKLLVFYVCWKTESTVWVDAQQNEAKNKAHF